MAPLATLLLAAAAAAADPPAAQTPLPEPRFGAGAVPILNYNSDFGLGFGAAGSLFHFAEGKKPYDWDVDAVVYLTTGGIRVFALLADVPRVFGSEWRFYGLALASRNLASPYYGIGNDGHATPDRGEKFNEFDLEADTLRLYLRRALGGPWSTWIGVRSSYNVVHTYAGSLLAQRRPFGLDGGTYDQLNGGFLFDTRDSEPDPREGVLGELTARVATLGLAPPNIGALFGSVTGFHTIYERFTLAGRVAVDRQWGDAPFTHRDDFGGLKAIGGLGGSNTLRGLLQNQLIGEVKLLVNLELRARVAEWTILERALALEAAAFLDTGRVWASGVPDGPFPGLHAGAGGGARVVWDGVFVVRADVARGEGQTRIYLDLGQAY